MKKYLILLFIEFTMIFCVPVNARSKIRGGGSEQNAKKCLSMTSEFENISWGLNRCDSNILNNENNLLNHNYKILLSSIKVTEKGKVIDLERRWINARDARCGIAPNERPIANSQIECLISETKLRIKWVASYKK